MLSTIPDTLLDLMVEKFRMLADPTRLAILQSLLSGEKSATRLVEEVGRGQANISRHLKVLTGAGFIARRKQGLHVFYRVDSPSVVELWSLAWNAMSRNAAEQSWGHRNSLDKPASSSRRGPGRVP